MKLVALLLVVALPAPAFASVESDSGDAVVAGVAGGMVGALGGAVVGALIGSASKSERWQEVPAR